jgi:uncharacterized protein YkwD
MWRSMRALCMLKSLALAVFMAGPALAGEVENMVLADVNAARAQAGCGALRMNAQLVTAAEGHAQAMAAKNFFSHQGKDGSKLASRIKRAGYRFNLAAENIAAGQSSASEVMQAWLNSSGHRKNMLDCRLTETGIAVVYQPDDTPLKGQKYAFKYYWVQDFARP